MPPRFLGGAVLLALAASAAAQTPQGIPPEQLARIKAATVYVMVTEGSSRATGSGFLVQADGKTGWLVTNNHVVRPTGFDRPAVEVVFNSGTPDEWAVKAAVVGRDPDRDLAVLKVTAKSALPEPLPLTGPDKVPETTPVYVCGFPFGDQLATGPKKHPEISVGQASVSSNRTGDKGEVVTVQLNGALNPGNSGGPVVTTDGKLIGVAVRTVRGAGIGEAIPHTQVAELLRGRVGISVYQSRLLVDGHQVRLDARVADPLGRLKGTVRGYVAPAAKEPAKGAPKETPPAEVAKLPGAKGYDLAPDEDAGPGVVAALVTLPADARHVWVQAEWTDADGTTRRTAAKKVKVLKTDEEFFGPDAPSPDTAPPDTTPKPKPEADPGIAGLTGPDGKVLPPLATRLPVTPAGQIGLGELVREASRRYGETVTVDVLTPGVKRGGSAADGPTLAVVNDLGGPVVGLDFLIDAPTAAALTGLKLEGPPARRVAARLRGTVKPSPTKAYQSAVVVDEVGLLGTSGQVVATLTFTDESAKLFADLASAPARWVGSLCRSRVAVAGVTEEVVPGTDGAVRASRLVFQTAGGRPVTGVKVYLEAPLAAAAAEAHRKHGGGVQNAELEFKPLRVDRTTGDLVCGAAELKLYAPGWTDVRWEGTGDPRDPAPPPPAPVTSPASAATPPAAGPSPGAVPEAPSAVEPRPKAPTPVPQTPVAAPAPAPAAPAQSDRTGLVFMLGLAAGVVLLAVGGGVIWLVARGRGGSGGRGRDDEDEDDARPRRRRRRA